MKIVSFLRKWVTDIVIMFIFVTVLEMILPSNNMKKYIDVIIGFLIILVIVNPFIQLFSNNFNMNNLFLKRSKETLDAQYEENQQFLDSNNRQMLDIYKMNMGREIKNIVEDNTEYRIEKVDLDIDEDLDSENYGDLENMILIVDLPVEGKKEKERKIKIEKINIKNKKNNEKVKKEFSDKKEIKKIISKYYDLPYENIEVYLNTQLEGD